MAVRNKQELLAAATEWMNHVNADLRGQMSAFIESTGRSASEVADMLGIDPREVSAILGGNADVKCSTLAKLLIATNNVLEVKPLDERGMLAPQPRMERDANGRFVSRKKSNGRAPQMMPPMGGRMPQMMSPMGGFPNPQQMAQRMGGMPTPPPIGQRFGGMPGMGGRMPQMPPMGTQMPPQMNEGGMHMTDGSEFDGMHRNQLVNIVLQNGWANEIDLRSATKGELVEFLMAKTEMPTPELTPRQNVEVAELNEEATTANAQESESANTTRLAQLLAEEMQANPSLRETIGRYFGN